MNPEESVKQKLERYQRTQNLTNQISFNQASQPHSETGQESTTQTTSSREIQEVQNAIARNDMGFVRSYIRTLSELDPANPYYSNLLNREFLSWDEFQEIVNNFSANHSYMVRMQDEINNLRLAPDVEDDLAEESPLSGEDIEQADTSQPEEDQPTQQPSGQEESSSQGQQRQAPRGPHRIIIQKPQKPQYGMNKEEYAKYKEAHKEERDARARELWAQRKADREGSNEDEEEKKKRLRRPGENQATGKNPLSDKLNNWAKNKFNNSRLGRAFNNSRFSRALNAPSRLLNNIGNRLANTNFGRGLTRANNLLNAPSRFLNNLASRFGNWAGNALRNLGSQALRAGARLAAQGAQALANAASRVLSNLGSQAAGTAARTAAMTAGRGALALLGAIGIPGLIIILIVGLFIWTLWFAMETDKRADSECGKPGDVRIEKMLENGKDAVAPGEDIRYQITVVFNLLCRKGLANIVVTDILPENTTYVSSSVQFFTAVSYLRGPVSPESEPGAQGKLQPDGKTVLWTLNNMQPERAATLSLVVRPDASLDKTWVVNEATAKYTTLSPVGSTAAGGKIINSQSQSLDPTFVAAAQNENIPAPLLKAIAKTEAPKVFDYNEEEFLRFSTPGWWEGLEAGADTLGQNHPDVIRGYAYNTCAYRGDCAVGADVRGVTQFELATWNGITGNLKFSDNHVPDRRNATDAIYGAAVLNRRNAESYVGSPNIDWTEDVVRAVARMYCGGSSAGKNPTAARSSACGWNGSMGYDDFVWRDYKILTGQP